MLNAAQRSRSISRERWQRRVPLRDSPATLGVTHAAYPCLDGLVRRKHTVVTLRVGPAASVEQAAQVVFIALPTIGPLAAGDFPQVLGKPDAHVRRFPDTTPRGAVGGGPPPGCHAPADGHPRLFRRPSRDRGGPVRRHLDRSRAEAVRAHRRGLGACARSLAHRRRRMARLPQHPPPVRGRIRVGRSAAHLGRHLPRIPAVARSTGTAHRGQQQDRDGPLHDRDRGPRALPEP